MVEMPRIWCNIKNKGIENSRVGGLLRLINIIIYNLKLINIFKV